MFSFYLMFAEKWVRKENLLCILLTFYFYFAVLLMPIDTKYFTVINFIYAFIILLFICCHRSSQESQAQVVLGDVRLRPQGS